MSGIDLIGPINSGDAAGSAGSATANADSVTMVSGEVLAAYVRYNDSPPATTDVTIKTSGSNPPSNTILTLSNVATDGWFYPRHVIQDETGADVTFDGTNEAYAPVPVHDRINVAIAGANEGDSADVWLLVRC